MPIIGPNEIIQISSRALTCRAVALPDVPVAHAHSIAAAHTGLGAARDRAVRDRALALQLTTPAAQGSAAAAAHAVLVGGG